MHAYLIVFFGAGVGGALRHGVNVAALALFGPGFPFGTLCVNIAGSFALGLLSEYFALKFDPGFDWRLFLTTGVLGGFTTFSAFSLDAALMFERGASWAAAGYVLLSVVVAIVGLLTGATLVRQVL